MDWTKIIQDEDIALFKFYKINKCYAFVIIQIWYCNPMYITSSTCECGMMTHTLQCIHLMVFRQMPFLQKYLHPGRKCVWFIENYFLDCCDIFHLHKITIKSHNLKMNTFSHYVFFYVICLDVAAYTMSVTESTGCIAEKISIDRL